MFAFNSGRLRGAAERFHELVLAHLRAPRHLRLARAFVELKRAAVEWAADETRGKAFQRKQNRLIELALVVLDDEEVA